MSDYYTIQDFEKALFAVAVNPGDADAVRNPSEKIWRLSNGVKMSDAEIQRRGKWVPVQENPRPLTADDITDEMADRFIAAYMAESGPLPGAIRAGLVAMHTPPPSRPEGAEDIEALIRDAENAGEGADNEALANYLAARLTDPTAKEQS